MASGETGPESIQKEAAARFEQMAALMELLGQNRFKVNAMAKAARTIADFTGDFATIQTDPAKLKDLDGIGAGTADRIVELATAGSIAEHDELLAKVPAGLLAVLEVPGLGPKTVKAMWDTIGVESVDDLRRVLDSGEILKVPRMGQKAADKIKESLAFLGEANKRHPVGLARPLAEALIDRITAVKGVERAAYAGSMRRGRETVGDIDILCVATDPAAAHESLKSAGGVRTVMAAGDTKTSVRMNLPDDVGRWKGFLGEEHATIQVDLRTVPAESWGAALMYFTGSKAHNVKLRER
ncbi:MAG: helix-hairpin-helix domain-containing protein, partial [Pseudomonadota bacterium]